jgi:hypothetical protein
LGENRSCGGRCRQNFSSYNMLTVDSVSFLYNCTRPGFLSSRSGTALLVSSNKPSRRLLHSRPRVVSKCCMTKYVSKESTHKKLTVAAKDSWFSKDLQLLGIVPFIPNWILLALYGYLGFRFFSGFDQTTYNKNSRLLLSILWPIMFIANDRFRQNFKKALKQGDEER